MELPFFLINRSNFVFSFIATKRIGFSEEKEKSRKVLRKYYYDYIKDRLIKAGNDFEPEAQWIEYPTILSNELLKPSKLQRRLSTYHPQSTRKPK